MIKTLVKSVFGKIDWLTAARGYWSGFKAPFRPVKSAKFVRGVASDLKKFFLERKSLYDRYFNIDNIPEEVKSAFSLVSGGPGTVTRNALRSSNVGQAAKIPVSTKEFADIASSYMGLKKSAGLNETEGIRILKELFTRSEVDLSTVTSDVLRTTEELFSKFGRDYSTILRESMGTLRSIGPNLPTNIAYGGFAVLGGLTASTMLYRVSPFGGMRMPWQKGKGEDKRFDLPYLPDRTVINIIKK